MCRVANLRIIDISEQLGARLLKSGDLRSRRVQLFLHVVDLLGEFPLRVFQFLRFCNAFSFEARPPLLNLGIRLGQLSVQIVLRLCFFVQLISERVTFMLVVLALSC